jgi:hypothetical protein
MLSSQRIIKNCHCPCLCTLACLFIPAFFVREILFLPFESLAPKFPGFYDSNKLFINKKYKNWNALKSERKKTPFYIPLMGIWASEEH